MSILFQAHRGVSTEYPENTLTAVIAAAYQGYDFVEVDPKVTKDGEIVLLHDNTLNRTARNQDGTALDHEIFLSDLTYADLSAYEFGGFLSRKFKGEPIPLLSDIFAAAKRHGLAVKIDNTWQKFTPAARQKLFDMARESGAEVAFTVNDLTFVPMVLGAVPNAEIHYDGVVDEEILHALSTQVPREKLTVWLPYRSPNTLWVKVPFADEAMCEMVKKYARLGLWILYRDGEFEDAMAKFAPDIIETDGRVKPRLREGVLVDMHTHSRHSHDSVCPVADMASSAAKAGMHMMAVTDHCDIQYADRLPLADMIAASAAEAREVNAADDDIDVLCGVEIGEGFWDKEEAERIAALTDYDIVIGSVHAAKYKEYEMPYSRIDFGALGKEASEEYLDRYFDDVMVMLRETETDILPHLTCPFRYINGKYGLGISVQKYEDRIEEILRYIIAHGIPLEVNTSCKGSGYDEFMPEEWIVARYKELGGYLVTLGSDAHTADRAAWRFDEAVTMLKRWGFKNVYYLKDRYLCQCAL